jgi:glycosyltransferase involved in cell wall biosynthesis
MFAPVEDWIRQTSPALTSGLRRTWRRRVDRTIYNVFRDAEKGRRLALLSYLPEAFLGNRDDLDYIAHSNKWQCRQIGVILRDIGFVVDVVHFKNSAFVPQKEYDLVFEMGLNLDRIGGLLPESCIKIVYSTGNHWLFQNRAGLERLAALKRRRNAVLVPRRLAPPTCADLSADAFITVGNDFTRATYSHVTCPMYAVNVSFPDCFQTHERRRWSAARRNFLWFGGYGAVHKGLDLVLETFSRMPELALHVVGDVERERDFFQLYRKELLGTQNITYHGYLHYATDGFAEVAQLCSALVYPSCSEAGCGSVVACMLRGLIPIISRESGLDVGDYGIVLDDCSLETICAEATRLSNLGNRELQRRSDSVRDRANRLHSRSAFSAAMRTALSEIVDDAR